MDPDQPLSLLLRTEAKKKTSRAGIALSVVGVAVLGVSAYAWSLSGAQIAGGLTTVIGLAALGGGISMLRKAAQAR